MAVNIAKMLGAGDKAYLGHMGARCFVKIQQDRDGDAARHTNFDPNGERQHNCGQNSRKVIAVVGPRFFEHLSKLRQKPDASLQSSWNGRCGHRLPQPF